MLNRLQDLIRGDGEFPARRELSRRNLTKGVHYTLDEIPHEYFSVRGLGYISWRKGKSTSIILLPVNKTGFFLTESKEQH